MKLVMKSQGEKRVAREIFDCLEIFIVAIAVVIIVFTFVLRIGSVDGNSMNYTLFHGDRIIISHIFYSPKAGDVVVVNERSGDESVPLIKRVIATEGQTVDIKFKEGIVIVDGQVLDEPYISEPTHLEGDILFPQTVPEGCVFVLGDNRNASRDSRFESVGMVDVRDLLGKAVFRFMPINRLGVIN